MFLYGLMYAWCLFHSFSCIIFKFLEIFQKPLGSFEDALGDAWELDPFLDFVMNRLAARLAPQGDVNTGVITLFIVQ